MKTVRESVFETNSSSMHSLTVVKRLVLLCDRCGTRHKTRNEYGNANLWYFPDKSILCDNCINFMDKSYWTEKNEKQFPGISKDWEALQEGLLDPMAQAKPYYLSNHDIDKQG